MSIGSAGRDRLRDVALPVAFAALVLGAWEAYVRIRGTADYVLPPPSRVAAELWSMLPDIGGDVRVTVHEAVVGLLAGAAGGAVLALVIAVSPLARRAVYPALVVSQTIPAIIWAPVLAVWLGFGTLPKIVVVALVAFFPVVVSSVDALVRADRDRIDLVRSFGASRATVLRTVQIPEALPAFFAGAKIAASYAVVAAVIGEWMGTSEGLGLVMTRAQRAFRTDRVFAAVVVVAVVSLALFAIVGWLSRLAMPWTRVHGDPNRRPPAPRVTARRRRRVPVLPVAALAVALVATACGGDDGDDGDAAGPTAARSREVTLVLNWTPNAHHVGVYAADALGWYDEVGIDLEIVEPTAAGADAIVGAGEAAFGISQAESLLPARAEGVPIVSIATILPVNDSALMSLPEDGITDPAALPGKTFGGYGGPLERELIDRLVTCAGGDPGAVQHVEVGNIDYLPGLDADRFDAVWIFAGWDALRASAVEEREVNLLRFSDHLDCIPNWYTPVFITGEDTVADDPQLVRDFLAATARGYALASDDPQRAAELMLEAVPEMDETLLRAAADYHSTRFAPDAPFGTQERSVWATFAHFLVKAGLIDEEPDPDTVFTNDFLPS